MLVLQRKVTERIVIVMPDGPPIYVSIERIVDGTKVKLGIVAPLDIPVHRESVYEDILREQRARDAAARAQRPEPREAS